MSLQHLTLKPDDLRHSRNIRSSHGIKHMRVHKNEVYYADPDPVIGSEQGGIRPVLAIQNDIGNQASPTIIIAPITSRKKSQG